MKYLNITLSFFKVIVCCVLVMQYSCEDPFQYNPNEVKLEDEDKALNQKNIAKILAKTASDTLRFIQIADTHHDYENLELFVSAMNSMSGIDFIVNNGDMTSFGLQTEFLETNTRLKKLKFPYISIIGNHDLLGNGSKVYQEMYGSLDFHFTYNRNKFIFVNTNSREYSFNGKVPDLDWLSNELQDTAAFDHDFDANLESDYENILATSKKVKLSLHGHKHTFSLEEYFGDGIGYLISGDIRSRTYVLITIWNDTVSVELKTF